MSDLHILTSTSCDFFTPSIQEWVDRRVVDTIFIPDPILKVQLTDTLDLTLKYKVARLVLNKCLKVPGNHTDAVISAVMAYCGPNKKKGARHDIMTEEGWKDLQDHVKGRSDTPILVKYVNKVCHP